MRSCRPSGWSTITSSIASAVRSWPGGRARTVADGMGGATVSRLPTAIALVVIWVGALGNATARPVRPLFEPTDLELEEPGILELDLQAGVVRGTGPYRAV